MFVLNLYKSNRNMFAWGGYNCKILVRWMGTELGRDVFLKLSNHSKIETKRWRPQRPQRSRPKSSTLWHSTRKRNLRFRPIQKFDWNSLWLWSMWRYFWFLGTRNKAKTIFMLYHGWFHISLLMCWMKAFLMHLVINIFDPMLYYGYLNIQFVS